MKRLLCVVVLLILNPVTASSDELPPQATEIIKTLEQESDLIRAKMELELAAKREIAAKKLQEIQDTLTRAGKLDEAVAIRDTIRSLKYAGLKALADPGSLSQYRGQIGTVLTFEVVGSVDGSVFGTDIYTDDSDLSTAAVHANILRPGEKGIVKVTILPGQDSYLSSPRNGLTSYGYNQYPGSYKVQSLFRSNRPAVDVAPPGGAPPQPGGALPPGLGFRPRGNIILEAVPPAPGVRVVPEQK